MKKYRFEFFASCPTGLEELLNQEIIELGVKTTHLRRGGVEFEAFNEIALKVLLYSRIASRVYKFLYEFEVINEKDYYQQASEIKWKSLMDPNQTFRLNTIFGDLPREREHFKNSQFATLKLKDAIVDYFRHFEGTRPSVEKDHPEVSFLARIDEGREGAYSVNLLYDLCGSPLHQRGYRIAQTEAPLKENLAAGLLKLLNWNLKEEAFIDAMCGSGTVCIEAALIKGSIPPSYLKVERYLKNKTLPPWTFLNYPWFTKDQFLQKNFETLLENITRETSEGIEELRSHQAFIFGNDLSEMNLISSQENAKKAKLENIITFTQKDALKLSPPREKMLFFCNPPYGERLQHGEEEALNLLYKGLGDHWKNHFKGHRAALFTGNLEKLKVVGLKSSKRHILYNGDIECRLAEYLLY